MSRKKGKRDFKSKRRGASGKNKRGAKSAETATGRITVTAGGFGFVATDSGNEKDIFIPPGHLGGAIDGDTVKVGMVEDRKRRGNRGNDAERGRVAEVLKIIERPRTTIVAELIAGRKARPLNKRLPDIEVRGSTKGAKKGDWIKLQIPSLEDSGADGAIPPSIVVEALGKAGDLDADIDAAIAEYDLLPPYTEEQEKRAAEIRPDNNLPREDMTCFFCVTIDPPDAKDHDDAISISPGKKPGEVELGVHIADVAAWVQPGSEWDKEAKRRGFTAYIPGKTLHMLPKTLTDRASLTPGQPTPAHSVIITIDSATGAPIRSRRTLSTVEIAARLTFGEVAEAMKGAPPEHWDKKLRSNIAELADLTRKMREWRKTNEKFIDLATEEIKVLRDDDTGEILGLQRKVQTDADKLVEECMLAANVEVAKELAEKKIPGLYRVHPEPDPDKLLEFSIFMEEAFGIIPGDLVSREACGKFLASLPDDHKKPIIIDAFLRSMNRAIYLEKPALHFGLGKGRYSHFTSPIRRYSDLYVHQSLRVADAEGAAAARTKRPNPAKIAEICSEKEMNIDQAYYAANDRLKLHYAKKVMFSGELSVLECIIRKVSTTGLLVDIPEMGMAGFVPRENLPGPYRKRGQALVPMRGGDTYKCGDFAYLLLERVDFIRGMPILRPA